MTEINKQEILVISSIYESSCDRGVIINIPKAIIKKDTDVCCELEKALQKEIIKFEKILQKEIIKFEKIYCELERILQKEIIKYGEIIIKEEGIKEEELEVDIKINKDELVALAKFTYESDRGYEEENLVITVQSFELDADVKVGDKIYALSNDEIYAYNDYLFADGIKLRAVNFGVNSIYDKKHEAIKTLKEISEKYIKKYKEDYGDEFQLDKNREIKEMYFHCLNLDYDVETETGYKTNEIAFVSMGDFNERRDVASIFEVEISE